MLEKKYEKGCTERKGSGTGTAKNGARATTTKVYDEMKREKAEA